MGLTVSAQELIDDAYEQGQGDRLAVVGRKSTGELGRIYKNFDVSGDDFAAIARGYYQGWRDAPPQKGEK